MAGNRRNVAVTLLILFLTPVALVRPTSPSSPAHYWAVSFGGPRREAAWSVAHTSDGGSVVAGWTESFGGKWTDAWILKLRGDGSIQWQKAYGKDWEQAASVQQTSDGGYIVAAQTYSFGAGGMDYWILKLDEKGNIQWQRTYGGGADDQAVSILETRDGGYIAAGETKSFGAGNWDVWVLKLDKDGAILWQKSYGGEELDMSSAEPVHQTSDGGYVLTGRTKSFGAGGSDAWAVKLDKDGAILWQKTYGGSADEYARSIKETPDGGYIVAGYTESFGAGAMDIWVLKLDRKGNLQWEKTYGGPEPDVTYSIQKTLDGGYVLAGETESFGAGNGDAWVLKLTGDGTIQWQKTYGGKAWDGAVSIRQTSGGYVAAGETETYGAGKLDYWVLKLDGTGNIPGCGIVATSNAIVGHTGVSAAGSQGQALVSDARTTATHTSPQDTKASTSRPCSAEVQQALLPLVAQRTR